MKPIYSEEEAAKIKKRLESKKLVSKNKKAVVRKVAESIKDDILIDSLLSHDDSRYFESIEIE